MVRTSRQPRNDFTCTHCAVEFSRLATRAVPATPFCSKDCLNAHKAANRRVVVRKDRAPQMVTMTCESCEVVYVRKAKVVNNYFAATGKRHRFCSSRCRGDSMRNENGYIDSHGYRVVTRDGERVYEHRWVLEQRLGRKLRPYESAHHLNGDRSDNRDGNIEHWSKQQPAGQRIEDKIAFFLELAQENPVVLERMGVKLASADWVPAVNFHSADEYSARLSLPN